MIRRLLALFILFFNFSAQSQDDTPPYYSSLRPFPGTNWHQPDDPLIIAFTEPVRAISNGGDITIYYLETDEVFFKVKSTDPEVIINGASLSIYPPELDPETSFYVTVDSNVVEDMAGNNFNGIEKGIFWFTTDDGMQPYITTYSPKKGSYSQTTCSCIEMYFDESIDELSGEISLYTSDNVLVETVQTGVSDPRIKMYFNKVNVDFSAPFEELVEYYITISEGAFGSFFTNDPNEPVLPGDWSFISKKEPHIVSLNPLNNSSDVSLPTEFSIKLDVPVYRYSSNDDKRIYLFDYKTDQVIDTINSANMHVRDSSVTITPSKQLPPGGHIYVLADSNVFVNTNNSEGFTGLQSKDDWNFVIGETEQKPNISTWQLSNSNETIEIPLNGQGYYSIDWGDGHWDYGLQSNATHVYELPGIYYVKIYGVFPGFYFNNIGDKDKILSIEQWGEIEWESFEKSFFGCSNLIVNATDTPDLSHVKNLSYMFANASSFNADIEHWDVSQVTNISFMFKNATSFDQELDGWVISNVDSLHGLFAGATNFNQPLNSWDVWGKRNLSFMFQGADSFNQPLGSWDMVGATNLNSMFDGASSFNQDLSNWALYSATDLRDIFNNSGISVKNYDNILRSWASKRLNENLTFGVLNLNFCNAEFARESLIRDLNWSIVGDGTDCSDAAFITSWETTTEMSLLRFLQLKENMPTRLIGVMVQFRVG